jgi:ABC-type bacteriocin/lantibiotic exporter with double-glycine peptidase domain
MTAEVWDELLAVASAKSTVDGVGRSRVAAVVAAIAAHGGLDDPRVPASATLDEALARLGVHWREVRLRGRWYAGGAGPLVAFDAAGQPVALLPSGGGYRGHDGGRVTRTRARELRRYAWQLYTPLPGNVRRPRELGRYALRGAGGDLGLLVLAGLASALAGGAIPLATGWLLTHITTGTSVVAWAVALLVGLVAGNALLLLARNSALVRIEGRMQSRVEPALWSHLVGRSVGFLVGRSSSELVHRANAIAHLRKVFGDAAASSLLGTAFGLASLTVLVVVDPVLGGAVLAGVAVLLAAAAAAAIVQQRHELDNREALGKVATFMLGCLLAIEKVQAAAAEERVFAGWARRYARQRATDAAALRAQAWVVAFGVALQPTMLAVLALTAVTLRPNLSLSAFIAATVAVGQFAAAAGALTMAVVAAFAVLPIYRRLKPVLDAPAEVADGAADPGKLRGEVELRDIVFTYPGARRPVLDGVRIHARPGEFVAVVGPSGAGKSTLVRLLLGLVPPTGGHVLVDGRDLQGLDVRAVRRQVGVVMQQARALRASIRENITVGDPDLSDADAMAAAERAGFADVVRALPMGLHTIVGEDNASFSGGQLQRLLLARALIKQPKVLVLDEATSALDNVTQALVAQRVAELAVTRIVVAHRLSTIRHADRIYVLEAGRVIAHGNYDHLLRACPLFARLVARQSVAPEYVPAHAAPIGREEA